MVSLLGLQSQVRAAKSKIGLVNPRSPFRLSLREYVRLKNAPRYANMYSQLLQRKIALTDPYWYLHSFREIFQDEVYRFNASSKSPFIIDCGANIGLSVIYFKYLYPDARIIAFEPDGEVFRALQRNMQEFEFRNVSLHQAAVWSAEGKLAFKPDGSVGGRLVSHPGENTVTVQAVRLSDRLSQRIDMLKIDIEGAEYDVLLDCREQLTNVLHLFVEYHSIAAEPQNLDQLLALIRDAGFRYHIKEANPVKHPFIEQERGKFYDLQLNIFAFRE